MGVTNMSARLTNFGFESTEFYEMWYVRYSYYVTEGLSQNRMFQLYTIESKFVNVRNSELRATLT